MKAKMILMVFIFPAFLLAQNNNTPDAGLLSDNYNFMKPAPLFGMQMGTSYTTGFAGAGMFSQSFAPYLQFRPGQNFTIVAGSLLATSSFSGGSPFMANGASPDRFLSTTVYALGAYQLNPRVVITGGMWGERNNMDAMMFGQQMNPQAFDLSAGGLMFGMDFKITERMSFGAEINVSRGNSPFNPYMNNNPFNPHRRYNRYSPW